MDLDKKPDALFIIDSHFEELAVREALQTETSSVGIVDTNSNPDIVDYPIPANDDAVGSIKIITDYIIDCWIEGRSAIKNSNPEDKIRPEFDSKENKEKAPKAESAKQTSEEKVSKKRAETKVKKAKSTSSKTKKTKK